MHIIREIYRQTQSVTWGSKRFKKEARNKRRALK